MVITVFGEDLDENDQPDALIASGVVERSPDWLACKGSVWALHIDQNGVRHESEIKK